MCLGMMCDFPQQMAPHIDPILQAYLEERDFNLQSKCLLQLTISEVPFKRTFSQEFGHSIIAVHFGVD